jgi:methylated-DNA-[protein]-cysteine S-methyltransferase
VQKPESGFIIGWKDEEATMNSALAASNSQYNTARAVAPEECCYWESPVGTLRLSASCDGLRELSFLPEGEKPTQSPVPAGDLLRHIQAELQQYFAGKLRRFTVPLDLRGTDFQLRVWNTLLTIPYGETRAYNEVAEMIGNPNAVRAVGLANRQNPIAIIVPCHRVIGKDGSLVGFGGGLWRKTRLLELESSCFC